MNHHHRSFLLYSILMAVVAWLLLMPGTSFAGSCVEFEDRIQILGTQFLRVQVSASDDPEADDTEVIVCAFETAFENGIQTVQLGIGIFRMSAIEIEDFRGAFQGTRANDTALWIIDQSVPCADLAGSGRTPSAIRFVGGAPAVRTMQIMAEQPCSDGSLLSSLVHFTGQPAGSECENDLIYARLDRVVLSGPGIFQQVNAGATAWAEGFLFGTCRNTLLGTLQVNRSDISGFSLGLESSMQGRAQVDVTFNVFSDTYIGYAMYRPRQNTSVAFNTFTGEANQERNYFGVTSNGLGDAPPRSNLAITNNTFNLEGTGFPSVGFITFYGDATAQLSTVAQENIFNMSGDAVGFAPINVSNTVMINNKFQGEGLSAVWIGNEQYSDTPSAENNAVLGNDFSGFDPNTADVVIDPGSVRAIVGPGQNATVVDNGVGTILTDNTLVNSSASVANGPRGTLQPRLKRRVFKIH